MAPADDGQPAGGSGDGGPGDRGSARQRTELAWTRTAIAFAALGAAILKDHVAEGLPILVLSALIWRLGWLAHGPASGPAQDRRLLLIAVAVTGVSVTALAVSLVP